jgi:pyridoxal 5'-phosphate synthase pdxT subunit
VNNSSNSSKKKSVIIGVLGFQGDIEENVAATGEALQELQMDGDVKIMRYPYEIENIDGLILPGGESTVQSTLISIQQSRPVLKKRISEGLPVLGTCAGMIVLSKRAYDRVIERNAFGRQSDSFEADLSISMLGKEPFKGVFIRAPAVTEVGKGVEVIGKLNNRIVAVKQENIIGTAFHPELSGDSRLHRHLIEMALEFKNKNGS